VDLIKDLVFSCTVSESGKEAACELQYRLTDLWDSLHSKV